MKINGHAFAGGGLRLLLVLSLLGCLLLPAASRADTRLTIVNPLSGDNISLTGARTSATPGGAPYTVYVINGTCHQADNVLITVTPTNPAGPAVFVNDPATIKGGVWEYNWHIPSGTPAGAYRIDAVLVTGTIPGSTASATVTLDATTPGLALNFLPSTVHNLVYAGTTVGVGNNSGDFPAPSPNGVLLLPIQLQLVTPSAFPYTAFATLSAPNSNSIIAKIVVDNAPGTTPITQFNNDGPPQPTADPHIFTVDGLPASFTVGSNGGLVAGLNTVSTAATVSSGGGAMSASSTYRRSIIVDVTKPSIDTGLTISNVTTVKDATSAPRKNTLRISGMVHDPDNAAGVPGGIASVAVIVQPPAAANLPPERHTAHLAYGATPDAPVSWTLDYNTSGKSGDYKFYALISDYAGNVTLDPVQTHTLDTTAPDVSALTITPAPNQGVTSGTITFTGSVNDADTTAGNYVSWKIQVATHGGGSFTPLPGTSLVVANSTSASISLPFSTEGLADGHYDFKITGTDRSGNSADGPVLSDIIVVNTAPKVTLALSPGDSTKPIAGVITLVGTITTPIADKDILDSFKLERLSSNGVPDVPPANVTTSSSFAGGVTTVTFTWNTMPTGLASAPSGIYSLQLSATDKAKHTRRSEPVQLDVDTDAPIVTILSPAQGQTVPVGSLAVISVQDEHPDTSLPIATFTAKDTATGKTATNTFPVIVTNQAAGLFAVVIPTTVTDAADSSKVVSTIGNLVTLTITASDATLPTHNTSTAQVGFFGAVSDLQLSSATWTDDQNNPLTGALTSTTSVPPASATALAVRAAGIQIFGTVNVGSLFAWKLELWDATGSMLVATINQDQGPNAKPIVAGLIGVINPGNTVTVGPGDYTLKLTTFTGPNMAGATSVWAPIRVDNAPPAVAITKPADGAFTGAMVEVDGTVSDIVGSAHYGPADDLKQIDIIVDGVAHHVTPSGNAFTAQFTLADGDHVITAVAADLAGNHAAAPLAGPPATPPNTIHVDTVPPKILIFSPVPQPASISFHNGTFVVAGAVDDAHPATWSIGLTAPAGVQVKASDVLSATSGTGANITATFNTKAAPDGRYTLTFTATDQAKNTATNSVDFYVDNTPPSPKFISPTPADGAIVNTLQTAAATITDNIPDSNNVLLYQILENGVPRLTPPGRKTPPSTITNVALQNPPANGAHVLQIVATDQAGNTNTPDVASGSQRTFFFDNIPPTIVSIQYTAPGSTSGMGVLDGSYLKNQIRIVITARDNLSNPGNILVPMVTLSGNGKSIPLTPNPVAGVTYTGSDLMWTADLPITPAASEDPNDPTPDPSNGLYRIDVSMTDKAGNTATSSATFNVVNGPPSASLRIPSYNLVDEFANALTYHPHPDMPMPGKPNLHPVGRKYYNDTPNGSTFTDVSVAYLRPNAKTLVFPEEMAVNSTLAGHNFVYTNPTPRAGNATGDVIPFSTFLLQLTDKQTQTLTVTQPGGSNVVLGAPILTPEGKFTMVFTATNAATDPASGLITQVDSRQLSVVVDSSSPVVTPLVPVNGVGSPIVVVPSSLFNFSFKINKPLKDVTAIAPILRDSATNAPVAIATVFRVSDGKQILSPISLASVISSPNLNGQGGIATFSGDAFRGFTVNWQMPVLPALYAAKQEYRVDITGVQDVVGNAAPTKVSYFFTVNVN